MATYRLVREIPADDSFDLVVLGGGPAGAVAAISAGRLGAKVLLIEATGCLGGMGTSGLVTAFNPMANGEIMLVGGVMREIVETLYQTGGMADGIDPAVWRKNYQRWAPFKVEAYKRLLDQLVVAAGVEVRFLTRLIDVDADKTNRNIRGVVLHNIEGYRYVAAKAFIDATGDAVLADLCGAECREAGRDTPYPMPATLPSLCSGINWERGGPAHKDFQKKLQQAIAEGFFTQPDRHVPGMFKVGTQSAFVNAGHLFNLNALRCKSMTDGLMLGRRLAAEYVEFYRRYMPGFENVEHMTTASLMGVRESRRIVGEYELVIDDYMSRRHFPDQIAVFAASIDIHPYLCTDEEYQRYERDYGLQRSLKPGESIGLPYGIMVPRGWENLWVAGRCVSSDVEVHGVIRVQPAAAMMGQAAGSAAVQSIQTGEPAYDLNVAQLIETLRRHEAYLPQHHACSRMTRTQTSQYAGVLMPGDSSVS